MNKTLYIVRHCEATGQSQESELTKKGEIQSLQLLDFFKNEFIDKVISSPYTRAVKSIEPLAKQLNVMVDIDHNLAERILSSENMENWLECLEKSFADFNLKYSGGESNNEAMKRACRVIEQVQSSNDLTTVIVTHGNLMTLVLKYFDRRFGFEDWKQLTNPDVYKITFSNGPCVERVWKDFIS